MLKEFVKDKLTVKVYESREEMGKFSSKECIEVIKKLLNEKAELNMIFAAAPSQNEFLKGLVESDIDWTRINAFHMDEYIGLNKTAPQLFGNFLKNAIFDKVPFKSVNYINSENNAKDECKRYSELLNSVHIDIVCMGIGENGHIAFNDPHVAFFNDKETVKTVSLDEKCRNQQVNDGCFNSINEVPTHAITLTIPTLLNTSYIFCVVPAKTKANAVKESIYGEISEKCPASILRTRDYAIMYLDSDSASLIL